MEFFMGIWLAILGMFGVAPEAEPIVAIEAAVVEERQIETSMDTADTTEVTTETQSPDANELQTIPENEAAGMVGGGEAVPIDALENQVAAPITADVRTMIVAGGCFWCVEADLEKTSGVIEVVSGYAGGSTENPTYQNYGKGGHREVVEVTYDASQISFEEILIVTMKTTDPTDDDGTFADRGDKYSAAFFYETPDQQKIISDLINEVDEKGPYDKPLAIDVEPRPAFWPAESNHQNYYNGTLTQLKYQYYRNASGRNDFIKKYWGDDKSPQLPWRTANETSMENETKNYAWSGYVKPDTATLKSTLDAQAYKVTQNDGTERAGTSPLDKNWERGIYVDILSGEPLHSSRDKFDSGTGWPSFVAPITSDALTLHEDRKLFSVRTETRSAIADNHIGHVFNDGPADRGGLRYCMNGVALRFVPEADMVAEGYEDFLSEL